jgi:hypothetical protein
MSNRPKRTFIVWSNLKDFQVLLYKFKGIQDRDFSFTRTFKFCTNPVEIQASYLSMFWHFEVCRSTSQKYSSNWPGKFEQGKMKFVRIALYLSSLQIYELLLTISSLWFYPRWWWGWWSDARVCIWITRVTRRITRGLSSHVHICEESVGLRDEWIGSCRSIYNEVRNSFTLIIHWLKDQDWDLYSANLHVDIIKCALHQVFCVPTVITYSA